MKICSTIILFFFLQNAFAQSLILKGKVEDFNAKAGAKVYYAINNNSYTSKDYIVMDAKLHYKFVLAMEKIKKSKIYSVRFSLNNKPTECEQRINISSIINAIPKNGKKNMELVCDLLTSFSCEVTEAYSATGNLKDVFVGSYTLQINDTIKYINLEEGLYRYKSTFKTTKDYMNAEFGSWSYDLWQDILAFNIWFAYNDEFGIKKLSSKQYSFKATDKDGKLYFQYLGNVKDEPRLQKSDVVKVIKQNGQYIKEPPKILVIEPNLPTDVNWKTAYSNLSKYGSAIVKVPEGEEIMSSTILYSGQCSDEQRSFSQQEMIRLYNFPSSNDTAKVFTVIDSSKVAGDDWVLLAVENEYDYSKAKPRSSLVYIKSVNTILQQSKVIVNEKLLTKEFINKWVPFLKNYQLKEVYLKDDK